MQPSMTGRSTARLLAGLAALVVLAALPESGRAAGAGLWECTALADSRWRCVASTQVQARTGQPAARTDHMTARFPPAAAAAAARALAAADLPPPAAGGISDYSTRDAAQLALPQPGRWAQCPPVTPRSDSDAETTPGEVKLAAEAAESGADNVYTLTGNAVIRHGARRIVADRIVYRRDEDEIMATGGVRFSSPGLVVDANVVRLQPERNNASLQQLSYALPEQHASGSAWLLSLEGGGLQHLEKASYTTCPGGDLDWILTAKQVDLDQDKGTGTARGAKLEFKGVPVAYLPYMSFPLDERRKSGVLPPTLGHSDETGTDISVPVYWNIAPNYDATLVPRQMSDRGAMLAGEFRYLHARNSGEFRAEYLDSDKRYDDRQRSLVSLNHRGQPLPRLETSINASNVSDDQYFEDLATTIVQSSQTSLERTAAAAWHGDGWDLGIRVQDFQTIDPAIASIDHPYRQLPRILLDVAPEKRLLGLEFSGEAELSRFDHGDNDRVTGTRLDLQPRISLPIRRAAWYVEPALGVRHTRYMLDAVAASGNDSPSRTTPVASLDAGSFFERTARWGDSDLVQTLEPRLFWLYIPERDQDDIPVFDTGRYDPNYWTLFRENRFTGPDRMGDANQATLALTTRVLDPGNGTQLLSASLGSVAYFRDRKITLPGETPERDNSSDLISEITMNLGKYWNANAELQWNPHDAQTSRNDYRLQYRAGQRQLINAAYRRRRDSHEQADMSFLWPLGQSWHMVGRWYYSLDASQTIEAIAGLGYESCCWGAQLVGRNYINDAEDNRNTAVFFQLELKGLGTVGSNIDDVLERGILGYQSRS